MVHRPHHLLGRNRSSPLCRSLFRTSSPARIARAVATVAEPETAFPAAHRHPRPGVPRQGTTSGIENDKEGSNGSGQAGGAGDEPLPGDQFTETKLGLSLLKNIVLDQKAVWTSPAHLRLVDANWIIPFGAIAAASLESDTHVSRALTHSPSRVSKSSTFSNYGI